VKIAETDPKDKLVAAVKDSFAFCTAALAKVDDSKLGEQFVLFGNRPISRGGALVALGGSWTDHYATQRLFAAEWNFAANGGSPRNSSEEIRRSVCRACKS